MLLTHKLLWALKAPVPCTLAVALTKLFPSHVSVPDRQAEQQPPPAFVPVFLELGWAVGGSEFFASSALFSVGLLLRKVF